MFSTSLYALSGSGSVLDAIPYYVRNVSAFNVITNIGVLPAAVYLPYGLKMLGLLTLEQNFVLGAGLIGALPELILFF